MVPVTLMTVANYLDTLLHSAYFPDDQNGIYHFSPRPISRLGLALEPWPDILPWVRQQALDALFLHRPWRLNHETFPTNVGILSYHHAFDRVLTLGFNPYLATRLQMTQITPFAFQPHAPSVYPQFNTPPSLALGMIGNIVPVSSDSLLQRLIDTFAVRLSLIGEPSHAVSRIAVVGAMTDSLVRQAVEDGAQVYITGQFRQPARKAIAETGLPVIPVGHASCEIWGLHVLADLLQMRWPELEIAIMPQYPGHL